MNVVVARLGPATLAAMMAVMQVNGLAFIPAFAAVSASAVFSGQAIGAGRSDDVASTVRLVVRMAVGWMLFVGLAFLLAPRFFLGAFQPPGGGSEEFLAAGVTVLLLSIAWQAFDGAAMAYAESLRTAGDTVFTSWARAELGWGVFLAGAWVTVRLLGYGLVAATLWMVAHLALPALSLGIRSSSGRWRDVDPTGARAPLVT